ncbi:MAG: phospholipase D family protein [Bacteriovorax sp.]|nr:phospholipase D family protein [Bacteriovorax sp.]
MMSKLIPTALLLLFTSFTAFAQAKSDTDIYPYRVTSIDKNEMQVINTGIAAFYARIDMIRRATTSLDLEYFIFNPDSSGRIIIKELIQAANRGVKVRILIDKSIAVFKLNEYYAQVLKQNNIEIRYYNAAPLFRISSSQFRNHRKLILRDGAEAITGGRNIADEYFNLSKTFNFLDRDIWVEGEIVNAMNDTFNLYWNSEIIQIPAAIEKPERIITSVSEDEMKNENDYQFKLTTYTKKLAEAQELIRETPEDIKNLAFANSYGKKSLSEDTKKHSCPEASFATDREGASFLQRIHTKNYSNSYRILRKEISEWMAKVDDEIVLDSPYFLNDANSIKIINDLLSKDKKITILTNSLASTDAIYVSTVYSDTVIQYTPNKNFNAYTYKGKFSNESEVISDEVRNSNWGTHSKTIVFNNNSFMIGTFNIDNRSNFYNTEMAVFCSGSPELANDVLSNIKIRMKSSNHLDKNARPDDGTDLLAGASTKKKILYYMLKIPAALFQFLL